MTSQSTNWTKFQKYNLMRTFALIIAGIPGAVLIPFGIASLVWLAPRTALIESISGGLMILTMATLIPGAFSMFGLLIANLVAWSRKTADPKSPIPKTQLNQIIMSVFAAAMPVAGYFIISNDTINCPTTCYLFGNPALIPITLAYLAIWAAITTIWVKTKPAKTTA